jgi:hypothetical protein
MGVKKSGYKTMLYTNLARAVITETRRKLLMVERVKVYAASAI